MSNHVVTSWVQGQGKEVFFISGQFVPFKLRTQLQLQPNPFPFSFLEDRALGHNSSFPQNCQPYIVWECWIMKRLTPIWASKELPRFQSPSAEIQKYATRTLYTKRRLLWSPHIQIFRVRFYSGSMTFPGFWARRLHWAWMLSGLTAPYQARAATAAYSRATASPTPACRARPPLLFSPEVKATSRALRQFSETIRSPTQGFWLKYNAGLERIYQKLYIEWSCDSVHGWGVVAAGPSAPPNLRNRDPVGRGKHRLELTRSSGKTNMKIAKAILIPDDNAEVFRV